MSRSINNPRAAFLRLASAGRRRVWLPLAFGLLAVGIQSAAQSELRSRVSSPHALAIDESRGQIYATDLDRNQIVVLDEATGERRSISVDAGPSAIAVDSKLGRVFVVCSAAGAVDVIHATSGEVLAKVKTDSHPYNIAIDTVRHVVFVTNTFSDKVTVIDAVSLKASQKPLGSKDFVVADERRGKAFLLGYEDTKVTEYDEGSEQVTRLVATNHLWNLAVNADKGTLYGVSIGRNELVILPTDGAESPRVFPTGKMPSAVFSDAETGKLFAANYASNSVSVFMETGRLVATIAVESAPVTGALDGRNHRLYILNSKSSSVTVIDTEHDTVVGRLTTGQIPYAVVVDEQRGKVFTAQYGASVLEEAR